MNHPNTSGRPSSKKTSRIVVGLLALVACGAACRRAETPSVIGRPAGAGDLAARRSALDTGPHTLSGTVFGGGAVLPGTLVEALSDGTATVVADSTTDGAGAYALSLADGTYDLRVTPPAGSGFGVQGVQNVVLAGGDKRDDIVLIAKGGVVSGHVRGHGGVALASLTLYVYDQATGTQITSTSTDADGLYQLSLGSGTYYFVIYPPYPRPDGAPNGNWYQIAYNLAVSGSATVDFDVPVAEVQGTVTDSDGAPVPGVPVAARGYSNGSFDSSATTDADGHYRLLVLTGDNLAFVVSPPAPLGTLVESGVSITADTTRDLVVSEAAVVSGHVRGHGGVALAGVTVYVYEQATGTQITSTTADTDGQYQLSLSAGTYYFVIYPPYPRPDGAPNGNWYQIAYNLAVSGSATIDFDVPVAEVQGTVTDSKGVPVSGATVAARGYSNGSFDSSATTDADGHYRLLVFAGDNLAFVVTPPAPLGTLVQSGVLISADTTRDLVVSEAAVVSGHVRGHGGVALASATVYVYEQATGTQITSTTTDADGQYRLSLTAGTYYFVIYPPYPRPDGAPNGNWYQVAYNLAVSGSATVDFDIPVAEVQGTVTDSNGAPVPGVAVAVRGYSNGSFDSSATTDAGGHYRVLVFTGNNQSFTVTPPAVSGFAITTLSSVSVSGDFFQSIILQSPDLSPPVIVAGPSVIHLSDTSVSVNWQTNEPSTSVVDYGTDAPAATVQSSNLVTTHEMTLVDSLPSTIYQYRVSSTDGSGNGPTSSALLTFRTQDPPGDITPPVITAGPTVTSVGQTTAIVTWTTDEPASTLLRYGTGTALGSDATVAGEFTVSHQITLSGLTPSTTYLFVASSTDPDGNGPTTSVPASFTTAAIPDTQPPIISELRVTDPTDTTVTVEWTTDEAASSGVSYNDGTVFGVTSDAKLVTAHRVVLAGLTPGTTYHVTASSTDLAGNGPTLGGPVDGTTLASPTNTAPQVTVPPDQVVEATGPAGAVVTFVAAAIDAQDGPLVPICAPPAGSTFPLGVTTVTCTATDSKGAHGTAAFKVTVQDTTPPTLTLPGPMVVDADASGSVVVSYVATATDAVTSPVTPSCTPASGSRFTVGTTPVACTATDAAHNQASGAFTVSVRRPNAPPSIVVPDDRLVEAVGPTGAPVTFTATASDPEDGALPVTCRPPSGTVFPIGVTTVTCTAVDSEGLVARAAFVVAVVDTIPPVFNKAPTGTAAYATCATGANVAYGPPRATDAVGGLVAVRCTPGPGSFFALGSTTVTCTARDVAGNVATTTFPVTVTVQARTDGSFFLPPLRADGSSQHKKGSTIPVKFTLSGASAAITNLSARLFMAPVQNGTPGSYQAAPGKGGSNQFAYDVAGKQYLVNLETKTLAAGTWSLKADLGDGVPHTVTFTLTR